MKILAFGTALFAFVLLTGCADDGRDGAPGIQGVTSLVEQQTLSVGDENCVYGGIKQTAGLDRNYNNILDDSEVIWRRIILLANRAFTLAKSPRMKSFLSKEFPMLKHR